MGFDNGGVSQLNFKNSIMNKRSVIDLTPYCPLCQDEVFEPVYTKCPCKEMAYCLECVLGWRLPVVSPWEEDAFIMHGRRTFASPCPICRTPLGMGLEDVKLENVNKRDSDKWNLQFAMLSVMCLAITDKDPSEVFELPAVAVDDDALLSLCDDTNDARELDAIFVYSVMKNRPLEMVTKTVKIDNICAMTRLLKHGYWEEYEHSQELMEFVRTKVMSETATWLTSHTRLPYIVYYEFFASYAGAMLAYNDDALSWHRDQMPLLVNCLRETRLKGGYEMHHAILVAIEAYDTAEAVVMDAQTIFVVASYLEHNLLGGDAAKMLKNKPMDATMLPFVHNMSWMRKYLKETCLMVNKIDIQETSYYTANILAHIMHQIQGQTVSDGELVLTTIKKLTTEESAKCVCEGMGDVMRLWLEHPNVDMDETLDVIKAYMWKRRNYASDHEEE